MSAHCANCRFWRDMNDDWAGKGECRRFPPVTTRTDRRGDHTWPQTTRDKWCGEFAPQDDAA